LEIFKISFQAPDIIMKNRETVTVTMRAKQRPFEVIKTVWGIVQTSEMLIKDARIRVY